MSTIPYVTQVRRAITLGDGSVKLEVTSTITDRGDLPFPDLFVLTIVNTADPRSDVLARIATPFDIRQTDPSAPRYIRVVSSDVLIVPPDTFVRIANINDITELPRDRVHAVQTGRTVYLSRSCTLIYDNLTTADAAYRQIIARLSSLVTEWRTSFTAFATNPSQQYALPQASASVEAERTAAYVAARDARVAAEATRDAAVTAANECDQNCLATREIYNFLVTDVAFLETARGVVSGITETVTGGTGVASTNAKNFVLQQGSYVGDARSYQALLTTKTSQRDDYARRVTACQARCQTLANDALTAQNNVNAAQAAERAALASVYAVCPTFNPNTV